MPNAMGQKPLFGESGLGNKMNVYTWAMAVFNDQLYLGSAGTSNLDPTGGWALFKITPEDQAE